MSNYQIKNLKIQYKRITDNSYLKLDEKLRKTYIFNN